MAESCTATTSTVPLTPSSPRSLLSTGRVTETPQHVNMVQRELVPVLVPLEVEVVWGGVGRAQSRRRALGHERIREEACGRVALSPSWKEMVLLAQRSPLYCRRVLMVGRALVVAGPAAVARWRRALAHVKGVEDSRRRRRRIRRRLRRRAW